MFIIICPGLEKDLEAQTWKKERKIALVISPMGDCGEGSIEETTERGIRKKENRFITNWNN